MLSESKYTLFFSVFLLSSCTLGPDYKRPPVYTDERFAQSLKLETNVSAIEIHRDWYKQFNDNTLNYLIETALKDSPSVNVALQKMNEARTSLNISRVKMLPQVDVSGSYNYVKDSQSYGIPLSTDYFQTGLNVSWEIDLWGTGRRLTESQEALFQGAAADLNNVYLSLSAEVVNNYISLRSAQDQLSFMRQNLKLQERIYELVKAKYKAGLASDTALNQAHYMVENHKSQIPMLEMQEEAYKNSLAVLCGRLPGEMNEWFQPQKNLIRQRFNYPLKRIYNLPVEVVRNRPDVRAVEQNLIAQNALVGEAIGQLFPSMSLSGFFGFQSSKVHGLANSSNKTYSYSPAISLPLWNWGALTNNVKLQKYKTLENFYLYQNSLLNAAADIKNAFTELEKEYTRNDSLRKTVLAQKKVAALSLIKYRNGLVGFDDVLTAQQNLVSAQIGLIESNAGIYNGINGFYKAVGGGYAFPSPKEKVSFCKKDLVVAVN